MKKIFFLILIFTLIAGVVSFWFWQKKEKEDNKTILSPETVSETKQIPEEILDEEIPIIDVNTHVSFDANKGETLKAIMKKIPEKNQAALAIVSPPPFQEDMGGYDSEELLENSVENIKIAGGGGSLNVMIQKYAGQTEISNEVKKEFQTKAEKIAASGAAAFGEITALHLALGPNHPFESAAPNHPLFLLLADLSAEHNLPILFHMEAVKDNQTTPPKLSAGSSANPATLQANIQAFEELLDYNSETKIIWLQAGWDHTGNRTIALMTELLKKHPNLFLGLKTGLDSFPANSPLDSEGNLKEDWENFLVEYSDRFVIASDNFFSLSENQQAPSFQRQEGSNKIIKNLPEETAKKIAYENALKIFNLKINW